MNVGDFMSKVSNVITMLELLQSGRKYSINELSNKLEVSERMIRVYKEDLEKIWNIYRHNNGAHMGLCIKPIGSYAY